MSDFKRLFKSENNKLVGVVLAYLSAFVILNFITEIFFGTSVLKHLIWVFWSVWVFTIYRIVFPSAKNNEEKTQEVSLLNFYSLGGALIVLGKTFIYPFSSFGDITHVIFQTYALFLPPILFLSSKYYGNALSREKQTESMLGYWQGLWRTSQKFVFFGYLFILILVVIFSFLSTGTDGVLGWRYFLTQDQRSYEELSNGCNVLLAQTNHTKDWEVQGDDPSLPFAIQGLHAKKITVHNGQKDGNNSVLIMIGVGRSGLSITWGPEDYLNRKSLWKLSVSSDGENTVVFSNNQVNQNNLRKE